VWAPFSKRRLLRTCVRIQKEEKGQSFFDRRTKKKVRAYRHNIKSGNLWRLTSTKELRHTHTIITAQPASRPPTGALFFVIKKKRYIIPSSHPLEAFKKREMYLELYRQTSSYLSFSLVRLSLSYTFISFLSGYKMISRLFSVVY
jgi:hypothetical protein